MCYGMNCPHENRYDGECVFQGRGPRPCREERFFEEIPEFIFSEAALEEEEGDDELSAGLALS